MLPASSSPSVAFACVDMFNKREHPCVMVFCMAGIVSLEMSATSMTSRVERERKEQGRVSVWGKKRGRGANASLKTCHG